MDRGAAARVRRTQPRGVRSETRSRLRIRPGPSPLPESLFRMLNLKEYRGTADRLADHLPWAALVAPGVVLNKDGRFQRTLRFRGPDLESATESELVSVCARAKDGRACRRERAS